MGIRNDAEHETYDVIVIGSGLGGLSAGAMLARAGRRVLVVERHDRPGGYAHAFRRRKYLFDSAVHMITGAAPGPLGGPVLIDGMLSHLGVSDHCKFTRVDPLYSVQFPGLTLSAPSGPGFLEEYIENFPHERRGLRRLHRLTQQVAREVLRLPGELSTDELSSRPDLALCSEYREKTVQEVFDQFLDDPRLKAALSALWPYMGLPPSRGSFVFWAVVLMTHVELGGYYCIGSFQQLIEAFSASVTLNGGELMYRTTVRRILVAEDRVTGVQLDNGQRLTAPVVISNVDPYQTFDELIGADKLPDRNYLNRLRNMRPSMSAAVLYLATDLDLGSIDNLAHETFLYDYWDHDESYRQLLEGRPTALSVTIPTLIDPSLAPEGEHLVIATSLVPYDTVDVWREHKPAYEQAMLDRLTQFIPDLAGRIRFREGGTPRTMERYTLNLRGAIYGWEQSPDQSSTERLPHRTPFSGLYLSGHWTQPGGGVQSVLTSGAHTAEMITGQDLLGQVFRQHRRDRLTSPPAA